MKNPNFLNRELGILAFNERVLSLAQSADIPLLERLRYLAIVSSNLDEFFEIRVAGLRQAVLRDPGAIGPDGLTPAAVHQQVRSLAQGLVERQYRLFDGLMAQLGESGIALLLSAQLGEAQSAWAHEWFHTHAMPVLTPVGLDPAHPFPRVQNKSLNLAVQLRGTDAFGRRANYAVVPAPRLLPRVVRLPNEFAPTGKHAYALLSSVLALCIGELFPGLEVLGCHPFRVTRNSDLFLDEEEVTNLKEALQGELPQRHLGDAVRLEVPRDCPEDMVRFLTVQCGLAEGDVYRVDGPVNLARVMQLVDLVQAERDNINGNLLFEPFHGRSPAVALPAGTGKSKHARKADHPKASNPLQASFTSLGYDGVFAALRHQDILLHHPFDSFEPVLHLLRMAVADPKVAAIKQTIYRTGQESEMMDLLIAAAHAGKEVTAVVELMARFDEETNINWAARLEEAGVHIVYGVVGMKTHAKMILIVRRDGDGTTDGATAKRGLTRYCHLSTGNYHARTARNYTDIGLITSHKGIAEDVHRLFLQLTGPSKALPLDHLWQAPFALHANLVEAVRREAKEAKAGRKARIVAKLNALQEPQLIEALYAASNAGVKVDLIVRGACALRPGVPGLSANITVRSVIGRFLEHSRLFYFHAAGDGLMWLSSADWMDRNFFRRIEIAVPVLDKQLKARLLNEGLLPYLQASRHTWQLQADGSYANSRRASTLPDVQSLLMQPAAKVLPAQAPRTPAKRKGKI